MTISPPVPPDIERMKVRGDVSGLVTLLEAERSWETRLTILNALSEVNVNQDGDLICKKVIRSLSAIVRNSGEHNTVRWNAIRTLGMVGIQLEQPILMNWVVEALSVAAKDHRSDMRRAAVESLGSLGARGVWGEAIKRIPEILISGLRDQDWNVREQVERALVRIGPLAVKPLLNALQTSDTRLRQRVADLLDRLHWLPDRSPQAAIYWIAKNRWEMCIALGEVAVPHLVDALRQGGILERRGAARALGAIAGPAVPSLLDLLEDSDDRVRRAAADALKASGWNPPTDESGARFWAALQDWNQCVQLGADSIPALNRLLGDTNDEIRQSAAWVLAKIGLAMEDGDGLSALVSRLSLMLQDPSPDVRLATAEGLGRLADRFVVGMETGDGSGEKPPERKVPGYVRSLQKPLLARLDDPERSVRRMVGRALASVGFNPKRDQTSTRYWIARERWDRVEEIGSKAIPPLLPFLQDGSAEIRAAAANTLEKVGWMADDGESGAAYWIIRENWQMAVQCGAPAVKPLIAALHQRLEDNRRAAAAALEQIALLAQEEAARAYMSETLLRALRDKVVRASVFRTLGSIGATAAQAEFLKGLDDPDPEVRLACADALDKIGWKAEKGEYAAVYWIVRKRWDLAAGIGAAAFEPLAEAYRHAVQPLEHQAAADALASLGDSRAIDIFLPDLRSEDVQTRWISLRALEKVGWEPGADEFGALYWLEKRQWKECARCGVHAVEPLLLRLKDPEPSIRLGVMQAFNELGEWKDEQPEEDRNLIRLALSAVILPLIAAFGDPDVAIRQSAAFTLGSLGDLRAVEALSKVLLNPDENVLVVEAAAISLGKLGDSRGLEALSRAFAHPSWSVRRAAARSLGKLGERRAVDLLGVILSDGKEHQKVRLEAAWALGQLGSPRAIAALMTALEDPYRDIRQSAAEALVNLYRTGKLDDQSKELILSCKQRIIAPHTDQILTGQPGDAEGKAAPAKGEQPTYHIDHGIGVEFE